jgi:opacity protein-like surface antigen
MKTLYVIAASVVLAASSAAFADTSDNAGYAPRADIEDPAWVKQLDAEHEARMNERPAFGEMPEFADAPAFETPEWVKQLDAEREARMNERPAFGEMPEFADAPAFETPEWVKQLRA